MSSQNIHYIIDKFIVCTIHITVLALYSLKNGCKRWIYETQKQQRKIHGIQLRNLYPSSQIYVFSLKKRKKWSSKYMYLLPMLSLFVQSTLNGSRRIFQLYNKVTGNAQKVIVISFHYSINCWVRHGDIILFLLITFTFFPPCAGTCFDYRRKF